MAFTVSLLSLFTVDNIFFLKFKVFNVPLVARNCSIVPQQDILDKIPCFFFFFCLGSLKGKKKKEKSQNFFSV